ncbi:MAG TPA: DUF1080 domain-containing protein [Bryobacteraceae bacterium]|nr:DUF1080 domain-containing protein [Bryobacteraceae bacterium]
MQTLPLFLILASLAPAAENTLRPAEKKEGWTLLFDGKTMNGWLDPGKKDQPGTAWKVEDGCLATTKKPRIEEDLITAKSYGDFELKFDWRVSQGGNSGVKYRIQKAVFVNNSKKQEGPGAFEGLMGREMANPVSDRKTMASDSTGFLYTIAFEFQLIDDERHRDALKDASHQTGALYSMIAAKTKAAKPAGEWNSSLLRVTGQQFEHWINGTKVLEGSLKDPAIAAGAEKRWGKYAPTIRDILSNPKPNGPIALQHHGDDVWFRNIKIRTAN